MNQEMLVHPGQEITVASPEGIPALVSQAGEQGFRRFVEFFTVNIRNPNTRKVYHRNSCQFLDWCSDQGIEGLREIQPFHVAAYIEGLQGRLSSPTVKQHLAAIRMLFDWLVIGQVVSINPATSVRGPKYSAKRGKTPVLSAEEARQLLDSVDTSHVVGLRDRAIIALMVYTFARVGAMVKMRVEDYYPQQKRWWVRLHEKGGKRHEMPAHHNLETYIDEYMEEAGISDDRKGFLFRTAIGRTRQLSDRGMCQQDVHGMIRRRAKDAGIETAIGCHTFRATGITTYLQNGGTLEKAQYMANHESSRTTGLYDRRQDEISLDEVERIVI
jgi:site-specific recombinase XerD